MAKKKRKPKGNKRPAATARAREEAEDGSRTDPDPETDPEADEEGPEDAQDGQEEDAAAAAGGPGAQASQPAKKAKKGAPKIRGRARSVAGSTPEFDPNMPNPDGPRVSNKGGLVFVAIVLALIGLAIAAQFTMDQ